MTNKNIAEVVTNAVVVALQQVLPTILATTENKPSEKKVTTKVVTTKAEKKETSKKAEKPEAKATTMPKDRPFVAPTEKQQAYYVSLCEKFGFKPKTELSKYSISEEIGKLKKYGKKATGYVAKGNKPAESKKTPETKVSVNPYAKNVHNLLMQVAEAQKKADYATVLHNLVAVAKAHAEAKNFAKAKTTIKHILDGKLTSVTPLAEDDKVIFNNTLSAITLAELTM